jgi:hypothetical protein
VELLVNRPIPSGCAMNGAYLFRCFRVFRGSLLFCVVALAVRTVARADDAIAPEQYLHGSEFTRELDKPLSVSREKAELRPLLERLSGERRIAIVLDRRIDPGLTIDAQLPPATVHASIDEIARRAGAIARVVGNTLMIGPDPNLGQLRTICVLRGLELDEFGDTLGPRRFQLAQTHTAAWDDLERPADLVQRIADRAELSVTGIELVPHDLWGHGVLVGMTAAETISWILSQYHLMFRWTDPGHGIEILPLTGNIAVTKEIPVRRIKPDEALRRVQKRFPELETRLEGRTLTATGLIEQLDVIAALARGDNPDAAPRPVEFGKLANRRLTLQVVRQPASAVLNSLIKNGIDVRIDQAALKAGMIDLSTKVSMDLKQATIAEVMQAICEPAGATFSVDGETVHVPARE